MAIELEKNESMLGEIETPALLLDLRKLKKNAAGMHGVAESAGVKLRPHVKTLKSLDAAAHYTDASKRITVSTLREAELFAEAGYQDILYSVAITPAKLLRAAQLSRHGVRLSLMIDSLAAARAIAEVADAELVQFEVMVEIDVDGHRAGLPANDPKLEAIAEFLSTSERVNLRGVAAHAGSSYGCRNEKGIKDIAEDERAKTVAAAEKLRRAGHVIEDVSIGSTPTALLGAGFEGVTEIRAGVFATLDLVMAGLGVCSINDIALSVLCTVIGHQEDKGWLLVDAGWMAMSRDLGTETQDINYRYGLVCDEAGAPLNDLILHTVNQEQGIIMHRNGGAIRADDFPYGKRLRILPVHACSTASQFEKYHVLNEHGEVAQLWPRVNAW